MKQYDNVDKTLINAEDLWGAHIVTQRDFGFRFHE